MGILAPQTHHKPASSTAPSIPITGNTIFDTLSTNQEYGSCIGGRAFFTTSINGTEYIVPEDCTISDMFFHVDNNPEASSNQLIDFVVQDVDTALGVSIGATQTGTFSDTTSSIAVKTGQSIFYHYDPLTTTAPMRITGSGLKTASVMLHGGGTNTHTVTTGAVLFIPFYSGEEDNYSTENLVDGVIDTADTIHRLSFAITSNGNTTGVFFMRARIDGVDANYFLAIGAGQTGRFTQKYGELSVVAEELCNWQADNADGNGSVVFQGLSFTSKTGISQVGAAYQRTVVSSTRHGGFIVGHNTFQGLAKRRVTCIVLACTVDAMTIDIPVNNSTVDSSVQIRNETTVNNEEPIIVFGTTQTGQFRDVTDGTAIVAGDEMCVRAVLGDNDYTIASACILVK